MNRDKVVLPLPVLALSLTALGLVLLPASALADWQYSKWGMSPAEFVSRSEKNTAIAAFDRKQVRKGLRCIVRGTYSTGLDIYGLEACFDATDRLRLVVLSQKANEIDEQDLHDALVAKYGKPVISGAPGIFSTYQWYDAKNGDMVSLNDNRKLDGTIEIHYQSGGGL